MLTTDEKIAFLEIIQAEGLSIDDFETTEDNDNRLRTGIRAVHFTIEVTRKSTGVSITYRSGFKSNWHIQFKRDLAKTLFG